MCIYSCSLLQAIVFTILFNGVTNIFSGLLCVRHLIHVITFITRVFQEMPVLVFVSMLAYFCFLEQLLVTQFTQFISLIQFSLNDSTADERCHWQVADNGFTALAIAVPFSFILGLLASMTSSTMGKIK